MTDTGHTTRKQLATMEFEELRRWLITRQKRLAHHQHFIRRSLERHVVRGGRTTTARQYRRFLALAADLQQLLDETLSNVNQYRPEMQAIDRKQRTPSEATLTASSEQCFEEE